MFCSNSSAMSPEVASIFARFVQICCKQFCATFAIMITVPIMKRPNSDANYCDEPLRTCNITQLIVWPYISVCRCCAEASVSRVNVALNSRSHLL
jgi:hypothetical protein